jgi:uncharacterized phage infection (PIP) family protein YhgE
MAEHGEPYNVARRAVMAQDEAAESPPFPGGPEPVQTESAVQEDYDTRYLREAEESGVPSDQVRAIAIADRLQEAADRAQDAADLAEELADQAEEAADDAGEKAGMAEEAASTATEWASPEEVRQAEGRVELMQERAGQAREKAEAARQRAEQAQERAEQAQEAADQAFEDAGEDEDSEPGWHSRGPDGWHGRPPMPPRPPQPPRPPHPGRGEPQNGIDRLMGRLDQLEHRFSEAQDRAATFLSRFMQDDSSSD